MDLRGAFVLPDEVVLTPVAELPEDLRRQLSSVEGDYALTRPGLRTRSKIVTAEVAALLRTFERPHSIADAVIEYSRAAGSDPEETLDQAFAFLSRLVEEHLLVPPGSAQAASIAPTLHAGDRVGDFRVTHAVRALEDTEVYQARGAGGRTVALKVLRPGAGGAASEAVEREALALRLLDGTTSPALVALGDHDGRRYLATEWCEGVPATTAAAELRRDRSGTSALLRLCRTVLRAYAHVHEQGVVHADVHPHNLLVDGAGRVRIIDYGLAVIGRGQGTAPPVPRGGIGYYLDPQYVAARLRHESPPVADRAGDQYSVAAMLYFLLTGFHYLEFRAEKRELYRQILAEPPRPFAPRAAPWPDVEAVLRRALEKDPGRRFGSLAAFALALGSAGPPPGAPAASTAPAGPGADRRGGTGGPADDAGGSLVASVVRSVTRGGRLFRDGIGTAPTASVTFGAAGVAYALYRLSCLRDDPALLAAADLWVTRAVRAVGGRDAFRNDDLDIVPDVVGEVSIYHTESGVHAVHALVSHAMGDLTSATAAVHDYVRTSHRPCDGLDLTLGRAGILVGCSLLLDALSTMPAFEAAPLRTLGHEVMSGLWSAVDGVGPVGAPDGLRYLGIAHGWAGLLYATLMWCGASGAALPPAATARLLDLAEQGEAKGRGLRWKLRTDVVGDRRPNYTSGWCNGSAGHAFLWAEAFQRLDDPRWLVLAERAGWNAWEESHVADSLCCGLGGAAYALLRLHRLTGEAHWWAKAGELGRRALAETGLSTFPDSLYKGTLGVALLAEDLRAPHTAAMPVFEREVLGR